MQRARAGPDTCLCGGRLDLGRDRRQERGPLLLIDRPRQLEQDIQFFGGEAQRHGDVRSEGRRATIGRTARAQWVEDVLRSAPEPLGAGSVAAAIREILLRTLSSGEIARTGGPTEDGVGRDAILNELRPIDGAAARR